METDPFDKELETDMIVPCDVVPVPVDITRIASEEEFKRQVTKLSPDELAFLLAQMMAVNLRVKTRHPEVVEFITFLYSWTSVFATR